MVRTEKLRSTKLTLSFGRSKSQAQLQEIKETSPMPDPKSGEQKLKKLKPGPQPQSNDALGGLKVQAKKPGRDYRTMRPDVREKILTNIVKALGLDAIEQLPVFFRQERIMPAKIGLFNDLVDRFSNSLDLKLLRYVVRPFFCDFAYLRSILDEKQRFDLDMNPVEGEQGEILEQHKQDAQKHIKGKQKSIKEWQQKKQRMAVSTPDNADAVKDEIEKKD